MKKTIGTDNKYESEHQLVRASSNSNSLLTKCEIDLFCICCRLFRIISTSFQYTMGLFYIFTETKCERRHRLED